MRSFCYALLDSSDHITQLERLGFKLRSDRALRVPSMQEIISRYHDIMKQYIEQRRIDSYFEPTFVFESPDQNKMIFLSFGEPIPSGFKPHIEPLEYDTHYDLISQNKFVLGFPSQFFKADVLLWPPIEAT